MKEDKEGNDEQMRSCDCLLFSPLLSPHMITREDRLDLTDNR